MANPKVEKWKRELGMQIEENRSVRDELQRSFTQAELEMLPRIRAEVRREYESPSGSESILMNDKVQWAVAGIIFALMVFLSVGVVVGERFFHWNLEELKNRFLYVLGILSVAAFIAIIARIIRDHVAVKRGIEKKKDISRMTPDERLRYYAYLEIEEEFFNKWIEKERT